MKSPLMLALTAALICSFSAIAKDEANSSKLTGTLAEASMDAEEGVIATLSVAAKKGTDAAEYTVKAGGDLVAQIKALIGKSVTLTGTVDAEAHSINATAVAEKAAASAKKAAPKAKAEEEPME